MTRRVQLKLNIKTDADILARLDAVPAKQTYIKDLIRRDISADLDPLKDNGDAVVIAVDIPRELHRELAESAKSNGVSLNQYALYKLAR